MILIEREQPLATLAHLVTSVCAGGSGRLVLVPGEAGAGKTSFVRALVAGVPDDVATLVGGCDSLRTARPFGPVLDWALTDDPALADAIGAAGTAGRERVFERALARLADGPSVAVLEDLHWADEATLDLLSFLARRIDRTRAALVVTYRSDEVGLGHPLSIVLGELATLQPLRVPIGALTVEGVAKLVGDGDTDAVELHARTGGNAFFVSECLSAGGRDVPGTVQEAVLARAGRLGAAARRALDIVAVVPGRAELWLARAMGATGPGLDECVEAGVLVAEPTAVRFRHELAREAVASVLLPHALEQTHRRALAALVAAPDGRVDHARVTHHAVGCGDIAAVLVHAPLAAAAAEAVGARREAVADLELALEHAGSLALDEQVSLWSRLADLRNALGRFADSTAAFEVAIGLAARLGDAGRRGSLLTRLAGPLSAAGLTDRAEAAVDEAISVLEQLDARTDLALAYATRSGQHMLARRLPEAERWGQRATELATAQGDEEVLAYVLVQSGVALWMGGDDAGLERLQRGVALAKRLGVPWLVTQGLSQIGSGGGEVRRYREAVPALEECVAYADRHELIGRQLYAVAWLARCRLELGAWDEASTALAGVLRSPRGQGIARMTALTALGRLRARRGDPEVWPLLDEALELARASGHLQRMWPVAAARAETAWLAGDADGEVSLMQEVMATATALDYPWAIGELGFWLWRAGADVDVSGGATPFRLHVAGDVVGAAAAWEVLGCGYERAEALADSEDDADQLAALAAFEALGAGPAASRLVERRRADGRPVPRGPNAATRANPGGLTERETDVLALVAAGCTNPEIARRLHISTKTVGHHVSHVLTKLGARSRAEAVARALEHGIELDR